MITVSVLYPNGTDSHFDMSYYLTSHMPMVKARLAETVGDVPNYTNTQPTIQVSEVKL